MRTPIDEIRDAKEQIESHNPSRLLLSPGTLELILKQWVSQIVQIKTLERQRLWLVVGFSVALVYGTIGWLL